ncbi:MAG: hypothetical protein R3E01_33865 [Pirellulaceae bacterium]|nr:hypothetical protein [Planctomycetales bacterium]
MRICDLQSGIGRLQKETTHLQKRWAETKLHWDDQACREFESKYLSPLIPILQSTLAAIHEMVEVVDDAQKACSDDERDTFV